MTKSPRLRFGEWTRRRFLAGCAMALAVVAVSSRGKGAETRSGGGTVLTLREQAILKALIAQILPIEVEESAVQRAHGHVFSRIQDWAGSSGESLRLYRQGLAEMDALAEKRYRAGFPELSSDQQIELLTWIDGTSGYYETMKGIVKSSTTLRDWAVTHLPLGTVKVVFLRIIAWLRGASIQDFWRRVREDVYDAFYSHPLGLAWIGLDPLGMPLGDSRGRRGSAH